MARAPDQRAIEAKELYDKGLKLIEIAKELDVPVGTVRSWKNRQCWDNATLQKKKRNVAKKRGGQPGNKNAKGHGGTGPPGNKNAVKTGEFETLFFDTLNPEELQLAETIGLDKEQLLLQEIQLLTVREYRMLHRIEALKNAETQQNEDEKSPPGMTVVKYTDGLEKGDCTELKEYAGILGQIQQIEDALTRVQAKKQKAIEAIHKFGYDDAKLELATMINSNRYVSCDYGTQNATVFLLWNKGTDGVWYCTREYYYSGRDKGRQKTDAEYAKDLESWLDGTEIKAVIVDPAAASFIAELRKRGFRVIKAKNDVEDGIRLVSTKLNLIKIIFSNVCQNTIKEFASYIWDAKAAERGEDKPIKQYDHAMDAVRYFVYTIFGDKPRLNRNLKGGL